MNMIAKISLANTKYHKSKNILTGITIFLTTLLLFLVLTIGYDILQGQSAVINEIYPNWHALYRNVSEETVSKLAAHHFVSRYGLRSDLGIIPDPDANISMMYMDSEGFDMYKLELLEGRLPEAENEIVVSKGLLKRLSLSGEIGDKITIPYQVYRDGELDFIQEKAFVISGFIGDSEENATNYSTFISKAFLEKSVPENQIAYRFLFQVTAEDAKTTEQIESKINQLANQFHIPQQSISINKDYLWANYVDPSYVPIMITIILIIVAAGIITIYSIYYVSMNERIQEFGKIKAIGATKQQLQSIVLLEGFMVSGIAVPFGLLTGTALTKYIFLNMLSLSQNENEMMIAMRELILEGRVQLYHLWIYLIAACVAFVTVYLSLLRPMTVAARVSEIEAMRYQEHQLSKRKGYENITVLRLTNIYLGTNKKKSVITICSMAITGLFVMVVATVLSCADPTESTNSTILGEYEISPIIEFDNKEHPELEWNVVQKDNPLTEELKQQLLKLDGIIGIEAYKMTYVTSDTFEGDRLEIIGIPESGKEQLEKGIVKGDVTYEELTSGDKVIVDDNLLYWYPDLSVGDIIKVAAEDGNGNHERELEIAAIGDYPLSFTNFGYLIMAQEGLEGFSEYNLNMYYHIFAKEKYNASVEAQLNTIIEENGRIQMRVWQDVYEEHKTSIGLTSWVCYTFLGILGTICIMNMINTMIHSVHIRKKEIGILQAVGLSDSQLLRMLQLEALFYTAGTLLISIVGGSLCGYPVFLWAKTNGVFNIANYHYPSEIAAIVIIVLIIVQAILSLFLSKIIKRESLINRIRFDN